MSPRIILPAWRLSRMLGRALAVAEDHRGDLQVLVCAHLVSTAEDLYALGTDRYAAVVVRAGEGVQSSPGLDVTIAPDDVCRLTLALPDGDADDVAVWVEGRRLAVWDAEAPGGDPIVSVDVLDNNPCGHQVLSVFTGSRACDYPTSAVLDAAAGALADTRPMAPTALNGSRLARLLKVFSGSGEDVTIRTTGAGRPALVRVGDDTVAVLAPAVPHELPAEVAAFDLAEWADSWADLATITGEDDK